MPFELTMKDLFHGCNDEGSESPRGPFSTNTRSLLVHSILNDLLSHKEKSLPLQKSEESDEDLKYYKGK